MSGQGKFKKQLSLIDLTFIGLGAIFGSGWLFAASHVSAIAGPAGIFSWLLGGFAVLLLGIVYCELGAALPRAGGVVRYPVYSHGPLLGYLMGFITLIAFSSLVAIEVVASRQYAAAWFPGLTQPGSGDPTVLGWLVQFGLLCVFFLLNYRSVKTFAKANNLVSVFKFIVPLLVIGVLFGLLLVTGTTIREVPSTVQRMFSTRAFHDEYDDDYEEDEPGSDQQAEDFSDGYYDDPSAYGGEEAPSWPGGAAGAATFNGGTPMENYPLDDEAPTVPEPAVKPRKKKPAKPAA